MSLHGVLEILERHPAFAPEGALDGRNLETRLDDSGESGLSRSVTIRQGARPAFVASLSLRQPGPLLVITPRPDDARRLYDQLLTFLGEDAEVHLLPEPEVLPFERLAVDSNTNNQRLAALAALASARDGCAEDPLPRRPLIVSSIGSALLYTLPPDLMSAHHPRSTDNTDNGEASGAWRVGDRIRIDSALAHWLELGYRNEPVVESPGCFSHRGGILDIFPPNCELPLRIELFDDEIETIRRFDPYTQRSLGAADEVRPIPAREQLPGLAGPEALAAGASGLDFSHCSAEVRDRVEEELHGLASNPNTEVLSFYNGLVNRTHLLDYLGSNGALVLERAGRVEAEAQELEERFGRMRAAREDRGELPRNFPPPYMGWEEFSSRLKQLRRLELQTWVSEDEDLVFQPATPYYGRLEQLAADLRRRRGESHALVAVTQHARRLAEILGQEGVDAAVVQRLEAPPSAGQVAILSGFLRDGWVLDVPPASKASPDAQADGAVTRLELLTDTELFGTVKERPPPAAAGGARGRRCRWPTWCPAPSSSTSTTGLPGSPAPPT